MSDISKDRLVEDQKNSMGNENYQNEEMKASTSQLESFKTPQAPLFSQDTQDKSSQLKQFKKPQESVERPQSHAAPVNRPERKPIQVGFIQQHTQNLTNKQNLGTGRSISRQEQNLLTIQYLEEDPELKEQLEPLYSMTNGQNCVVSGAILKGRVVNIGDIGIFLCIGLPNLALVYIQDLPNISTFEDLKDKFKVGDTVYGLVETQQRATLKKNPRYSLSISSADRLLRGYALFNERKSGFNGAPKTSDRMNNNRTINSPQGQSQGGRMRYNDNNDSQGGKQFNNNNEYNQPSSLNSRYPQGDSQYNADGKQPKYPTDEQIRINNTRHQKGIVKYSIKEFQLGQRIKGQVEKEIQHGYFLGIEAESQAFLMKRYCEDQNIPIGQEVDVYVMQINDSRKQIRVSQFPVTDYRNNDNNNSTTDNYEQPNSYQQDSSRGDT